MSLKAFHIVFIIFSTLLALGTGVWCLWVNLVEGAPHGRDVEHWLRAEHELRERVALDG